VSLYHRSEEKNRLALNFCVTLLNPIDIIIVFLYLHSGKKNYSFIYCLFSFSRILKCAKQELFSTLLHTVTTAKRGKFDGIKEYGYMSRLRALNFLSGSYIELYVQYEPSDGYMSRMNHQIDVCPNYAQVDSFTPAWQQLPTDKSLSSPMTRRPST